MQIYVDADACPQRVKQVLYKVAEKRGAALIMVANSYLYVPPHPNIRFVKVGAGLDVADDYIATHCQAGDLVITADVPLADKVCHKRAQALNPRGTLYTAENIKQALSLRNAMDSLRSGGVITGGAGTYSQRNIQAFANALDRALTASGL